MHVDVEALGGSGIFGAARFRCLVRRWEAFCLRVLLRVLRGLHCVMRYADDGLFFLVARGWPVAKQEERDGAETRTARR